MGRDLRKYAAQTQVRSLIAFVLLLLGVGIGLIYVFYGPASALTGLMCALAGLAPLTLIFLALKFLDWFVSRVDN